jgi:hypothetical protein
MHVGLQSSISRHVFLYAWVHSSVVRAADCRSAGPWFKSGCTLVPAHYHHNKHRHHRSVRHRHHHHRQHPPSIIHPRRRPSPSIAHCTYSRPGLGICLKSHPIRTLLPRRIRRQSRTRKAFLLPPPLSKKSPPRSGGAPHFTRSRRRHSENTARPHCFVSKHAKTLQLRSAPIHHLPPQ